MADILNVVVCGTRFGEHYLAALNCAEHLWSARPAHLPRYRLAGIVARGSARSLALAEKLAVPLYTDVAHLPDDIDIACVVVRSAIVGGDGSALARSLLTKGIHVLQEHPVHPTDILRLRALAAQHGKCYHVNTFYPHLPAGQRFIDYARQSARQRPPAFVEITTSLQLLYSSLDIVCRALGKATPFACSQPLALHAELAEWLADYTSPWPFRAVQGLIGGVPFSLNLQTWLDPDDPDHHSLVMHRIAIGGPEGNVLLANSYGPVVWSHPIYAPDYERDDAQSSYLLAPDHFAESRFNRQPTATIFGKQHGPSLTEAATHDFSLAIHAALDELMQEDAPVHQEHWWQAHGDAWLGIMRAVGPAQLTSRPPPAPPYPDPLAYAKECQT
ncbi:Gfo/Idh/MocA family oxidoreductase [Undibacterium sp. CY18W]|uniref:Gfo/Idh/MocA family oxidoreductase n=1 Tax=Undibacterium hunanense TaxID=2762292 RepID=A0ABR6ZNV9_9BURK|nr:Gfo/Idh/MocA family oxidoreductase [Undibacterium hunanense]MBC3917145.1 Gfo/Idh/MocA family oxidoreductase [Undibacterium hunanense]